jgi:hypothetical protein
MVFCRQMAHSLSRSVLICSRLATTPDRQNSFVLPKWYFS